MLCYRYYGQKGVKMGLLDITTNKALKIATEQAIKNAIILQKKANRECQQQTKLRRDKKEFSYTVLHEIENGVSIICDVLQSIFGGNRIDIINIIIELTNEHQDDNKFGYDKKDYFDIFITKYYLSKIFTDVNIQRFLY